MSAVSDFATKMKAHNQKTEQAITGLQSDNTALNEKIKALQASQGTLTAEDQGLLDEIENLAAGQTAKLEALDSLTPPTPPPG